MTFDEVDNLFYGNNYCEYENPFVYEIYPKMYNTVLTINMTFEFHI